MSAGMQADMHTATMLTSVLPPPLHSQILLLSMRLTRKYGNPYLQFEVLALVITMHLQANLDPLYCMLTL